MNSYLKISCYLSLALWLVTLSLHVEAKVTILGLHIGQKLTYEQLKKNYRGVKEAGMNEYTGMPMYELEPDQFDLTGLEKVTLVLGPAQDLVGVLMEIENTPENFYLFYEILNERYNLLHKKTPFLGSRHAHYQTDHVFVFLDAPYLESDMTINYIRADLLDWMKTQIKLSPWQKVKKFFAELF